jgi:hypothetical protein
VPLPTARVLGVARKPAPSSSSAKTVRESES